MIIYNISWDFIVSVKIYSFNSTFSASYLDLGVFYDRAWGILSSPATTLMANLRVSPIVILMAPIALVKSVFLISYFQVFWVSISAVPLYFIGIRRLVSRWQSLSLAIAYLVFFGTAGILWFDVHYQSLFIPIFFLGYAFLIYDKKKTAVLFLVLSGLVRFPYEILPIIFSLATLTENIFHRKWSLNDNFAHLSVLLFSSIFFILGLLGSASGGYNAAILSGAHSSSSGLMQNFSTSLDSKIFTVLLMLSPFLFLPLLKLKWSLLLVPYLFLLFLSGYSFYYFPNILQVQYWSLVVPFLFIGTIEAISSMEPGNSVKTGNKEENSKTPKITISKRSRYLVTILLAVIVLGAVYQPYGPLNKYTNADFMLSEELNYNSSLYSAFTEIVNLIPSDTPYVLFQNNMPEVVFHDPPSGGSFYGFGFPGNFTYQLGGKWVQHPQYVISDPYSRWFTDNGSGNFSLNMYETVHHLLKDTNYGVAAEYDGILLLEYNYTGHPHIYGPENRSYTPSSLTLASENYVQNGTISVSDFNAGQTVWYGPYAFLQPGNYTLTLSIRSDNISSLNSFNLRFSFYNQTGSNAFSLLGMYKITGSSLKVKNEWTDVTLNISTNNFLNEVEFAGQNFDWNGTVELRSISFSQTAPIGY